METIQFKEEVSDVPETLESFLKLFKILHKFIQKTRNMAVLNDLFKNIFSNFTILNKEVPN